LWVGLVLGIPLVLIGLSGSALLLQREILRFATPVASAGELKSIGSMLEAAQTAVASNVRPTFIDLSPGKAAAVQFETRRPARRVDVHVDPVSLEVLGASDYVRRGPIKQVLVDIHEFLMLPAHVGFPLVGWMGVAMTVMGLSGLVLWWPRGALAVRRGVRLHLDLHQAVGIWGLLVLLTLSISGVYLIFPLTVSHAVQTVLPGDGGDSAPADVARRNGPLGPDHAADYALALVPDARVIGMHLPSGGGTPFAVHMEMIGFGPTVPPIVVTLDPVTAEVIYIDHPRAHSPAERVLNFLHALHFSNGLGFAWSALVFLAGLMPLLMAVTGTMIWWKRRRP
jgi:uncharacterized iron-regulated membrane protein